MKKYKIVLGYVNKLGSYYEVKRFEISATDDDDAINILEANLRNYRGKSKAHRIYGRCVNEEKMVIKIKYYDL
jgi:hypothetical protein